SAGTARYRLGIAQRNPRGQLRQAQGRPVPVPQTGPKVYPIHNDEKMVLDLLLQEKILIVQGTAFNWPWPDHFRIVSLPRKDDLEMAIGRIANFLRTYKQ